MLVLHRQLGAHLRWADRRIADVMTDDAPHSARELWAHILGAEHVWLARLHGQSPTVAVWPNLTLTACGQLAEANADGLDAYLHGITEDDLSRGIHYVNSTGNSFTSTISEILTHIALHGQYHRGQVNLLLRTSGSTPAPVDYIAFTRGAPSATRRY